MDNLTMQTLSDIMKEWVDSNNVSNITDINHISNNSIRNQNDFNIANNISLLPDFSNILYISYDKSLIKNPVKKESVSTIEEILNEFYDGNEKNEKKEKNYVENQLKTSCNIL